MDIAIIGTGISGLVAARGLYRSHRVTLFEAANYVGGHTHTVMVPSEQGPLAVDTGFIVFNQKTYPNFCRMLGELGVTHKASTMSFSVKDALTGLEYNGTNLNTLFIQRRNLFRPSFLGMVRDILHFNKQAKIFLRMGLEHISLGDFLSLGGYGKHFIDHYILPMGGAIWSAGRESMLRFPMVFFARFLDNHGMLNIDDRPEWRVIQGGSQAYVKSLIQPFAASIRTECPVSAIRRTSRGVMVKVQGQDEMRFDRVILAVHSDQALALQEDAGPMEHEVLRAIRYQSNEAVLHTDTSVLPTRRKAWAAWNCHILAGNTERVAITYNMNILQGLTTKTTYCVTLNHADAINPDQIIQRISYAHPLFNHASMAAQRRFNEIDGHGGIHYCGAYWFNGFHEDGVRSGLRAVAAVEAAVSR